MAVRRKGKFKNAKRKVEVGTKRGLILAGQLVAQRATRKAPRDTGRLKRSLTHGMPYAAGSDRYRIDVGSNVVYAAIQEFGGTIKPKNARALAVPIGDLTGSPTQHDLTLIKPAGLPPLLIDASGKAQYVLVPQVTIRAQPYLRPALAESRKDAARLILKSVVGELRRD